MRILVLGGSGFLGREVVDQAVAQGWDVVAGYRTRAGAGSGVEFVPTDLTDRAGTLAVARAVRPDVVLNAAFRQSDWTTTADGAASAALSAVAVGARLVHVSSDAVFAGGPDPYPECATPSPGTPYGAAKAAAETAVAAIDPGAVIVRTSLILGSHGASSHERRVHELALGTSEGVLFTDDVRCPVHVADLASAVLELAGSDRSGIHHAAGPEAVDRYRLGQMIARRDGLPTDLLVPGLRSRSPFPGPLEVRLDCRRTQSHLRTHLRGVSDYLLPAT